jgi:hypothetical protein
MAAYAQPVIDPAMFKERFRTIERASAREDLADSHFKLFDLPNPARAVCVTVGIHPVPAPR